MVPYHFKCNNRDDCLALGGERLHENAWLCRDAWIDTDCNGATAGSVLGLMLGSSALPKNWIAPLRDTLQTGVAGYHNVKISDIARETVDLILS